MTCFPRKTSSWTTPVKAGENHGIGHMHPGVVMIAGVDGDAGGKVRKVANRNLLFSN